LSGVMLIMPLMLGVAYSEIQIQEYKRKRIKELQVMKNASVGIRR